MREAEHQRNCLMDYEDDVLAGDTRICFLRDTSPGKEDEPLVTIEVGSGNCVKQVKARYNEDPKREIWKFIHEWEQKKG